MTEGRLILPSGWGTYTAQHTYDIRLEQDRMWQARQKLLKEADPSLVDKNYDLRKSNKKMDELEETFDRVMKERENNSKEGMLPRVTSEESGKFQWLDSIKFS